MIHKRRILIVDDDPGVVRALLTQLQAAGHTVDFAYDGLTALAMISTTQPDLVLLDRGLPGASGDDVLRTIRNMPETRSLPVIMLTGSAAEEDELTGLELGADDYVTKPYSSAVLLARVERQMRRAAPEERGDAPIHEVTWEPRYTRILLDGIPLSLGPAEYRVLATLIAARGHVFHHEQLARVLYGTAGPEQVAQIADVLRSAQRKLGSAGGYLHAIDAQRTAWWGY
jgi:two-component system, OmpR family, phosphate regulon response regulator PhoB